MTTLRRVPGFKRIPRQEVQELLAQGSTRDDEASKLIDREVLVLADGRALVQDSRGGGLWPSSAALMGFMRHVDELARQGPVDLVRELLPPAGDFIRDVAEHAAKLAARLRVPVEALDGTLDSLHTVDKGLKRLRSDKRMTPEVIAPLVAYIGELLRRACDGRWEVSEQEGDGAPEPTILGRDRRSFQPFALVVHALDPDHRSSMHTAVDVALKMNVRKT